MKKGFGLMEVLIAAVVLGFLIVSLNNLQKGNREGILRVRARDAANFIAQHVLDSLGSVGINSLVETQGVIYSKDDYIYSFEGKNTGKINQAFNVRVSLLPPDAEHSSTDLTSFNKNNLPAGEFPTYTNIYNKKLEATVSWQFNNSPQSITVAKVVR